MNLALWIIAGLLAVAYLIGGCLQGDRAEREDSRHVAQCEMGRRLRSGSVKAIGVLEVLAAVGLILPAALHIAPILAPLAALGLVVIMAGAAITRLRRHETKIMMVDLVYLALAGFVAWGLGPESFTG